MLGKWKTLGFLLLLVVVLVSFLGLAGCKGGSADINQELQPLQLPAATNLTKFSKSVQLLTSRPRKDWRLKKWHDLFVKRINATGGWKVGNDTYDLNIITYDGGMMDDAKSRAAIEKLVYEDKVSIIIDTFMINDKQAAQICQQNNVLLLGEGFTDDTAGPEFTVTYRTTGIYFGRAMNFSIATGIL